MEDNATSRRDLRYQAARAPKNIAIEAPITIDGKTRISVQRRCGVIEFNTGRMYRYEYPQSPVSMLPR